MTSGTQEGRERHHDMRHKKIAPASSVDPQKALAMWDFLPPSSHLGKCSQRVLRVTRLKVGFKRINNCR